MTLSVPQFPAPGSGASCTFSALAAGDTLYLGVVAYAFANAAITSSAPQLGGVPFGSAVLLGSVLSDYDGSGVVYIAIWELAGVAGGETSASVTVTNGTALNLFPLEAAGLGAAPVPDQLASAHHPDAPNPSSGPTGNTAAAPELAIGLQAILGIATTPPPAPWTFQPGASDFCGMGYQLLAAAGESVTYSQSSSSSAGTWAALAVTIAGTPAPPPSTGASWAFDAVTDFVLGGQP